MRTRPPVAWYEVSDSFLSDGPPKRERHVGWVFVNECRVTKGCLYRTHRIDQYEGDSKEDVDAKVAEFTLKPDVRLLRPGVESNRLPRRIRKCPPDLIEGKADIYASK